MKTLTMKQIIEIFYPSVDNITNCKIKDEILRLYEIGSRKLKWNALDILKLPSEEMFSEHKIRIVLREEFIDAPILHEFACICAERVLSQIENPDPRSIAAIEAKRKWLRGEINDDEMQISRMAAYSAIHSAVRKTAREAAEIVYGVTTWVAYFPSPCSAAEDAARSASQTSAKFAVRDYVWKSDVYEATRNNAESEQVQILINLLEVSLLQGKRKNIKEWLRLLDT